MINIVDKVNCVGCNACVQICPRDCISMITDEQGFDYPVVDETLCIHCDACERTCPVINQASPKRPVKVYAARNKNDEEQKRSSSGGVFVVLAKQVINEGGVVFGARYDKDWNVIHDYAETVDGINRFQGSKYVQSHIGSAFIDAGRFLKDGRKVLFSGTPCQLAALQLFLKKDYGSQLLKVDVVCHGVPSPGIWQEYLRYLFRPKGDEVGKNTEFPSTLKDLKMPVVTGISFRDKRISWQKYGVSIHVVDRQVDKNSESSSTNKNEKSIDYFQLHYDNLFMQGFLKDLYLRPSCYSCPAKSGKSKSDVTLADFWGIHSSYPEFFKEGCYSLVLADSENGLSAVNSSNIIKHETDYGIAFKGNRSIEKSARKPISAYEEFWNSYERDGLKDLPLLIKKMNKRSLIRRIGSKIKRIIKDKLK